MTAASERSDLKSQSGLRLVPVEHSAQEQQSASGASKEILTVEEMASYLGIGRSKAYELARAPEFPALRLGKIIRIPRYALDQWIADRVAEGSM